MALTINKSVKCLSSLFLSVSQTLHGWLSAQSPLHTLLHVAGEPPSSSALHSHSGSAHSKILRTTHWGEFCARLVLGFQNWRILCGFWASLRKWSSSVLRSGVCRLQTRDFVFVWGMRISRLTFLNKLAIFFCRLIFEYSCSAFKLFLIMHSFFLFLHVFLYFLSLQIFPHLRVRRQRLSTLLTPSNSLLSELRTDPPLADGSFPAEPKYGIRSFLKWVIGTFLI